MATDLLLARQITADEIDFTNATGVDVSLAGTIYAEDGGQIGDFIIEDGELYAGAFKRSDNSITIGTDTSSGFIGKIDLRGPSGGTTDNLIYLQNGNMQHQVGEFLAANIRARGTTWFPSGSKIKIDEGASYTGAYAGETSGRITKFLTLASSPITLDQYDCFINYTGSSDKSIYLPASPLDGKYYFIRRQNAVSVTIYGNGNYINYGDGNNASSYVLPNRGMIYMFIWDGANWNVGVMHRDQ
jgi:hypothetical protein